MAHVKKLCDDCYEYLRDTWEIDCPKVCDVEAAKKKMKKIMFQNHPDKHPGETDKYTPIFQRIADCNDRVIKDRCTEFGAPSVPSPGPGPGGGPEFFEPSDHFGWGAAISFRYGAPGDEEFAKTLIDFLKKEKPRMANPLAVKSELGPLFQFFYTHGYGPAAVWARVAVDDPYNSTILKKADDAYLFILYITEQVNHVGPPISGLMKIRYGSKLIWPTSPGAPFSGSPGRRTPRKASRSRRRKGPTVAQKRADCRARGLVYDTVTGKCRPSKKGGKSPRRASRSRRRKEPTVAQKRKDCRDRGLVYDRDLNDCRPSKKGGRSPRRRSRRRSPRRRSRSPRLRRSTRRRSRSPRRKKASTRGCPAGYVRSPTGRCIKRGGAAYKKYFG